MSIPGGPAAPFAPSSACNRPFAQDAFEQTEPAFTATLSQMGGLPFFQRIECISRRFLGLPYLDDPLGEGTNDTVDIDPMFRFDGLDCMTYVEEVLALMASGDPGAFIQTLQDIRYRDGIPYYGWRNHFVEADWIQENTRRGFVRDITADIGGPLTQQVSACIDRLAWVAQKPVDGDTKGIMSMQFEAAGLGEPEEATMPFIPLGAFFVSSDAGVEPNWELIGRMPEVSILLMIRKAEDAERIGVIVAHMALAIVPRMPDGTPLEPIIRHATLRDRTFKDEPLLEYLSSQMPRRAGVAILEIRFPPPL